MELQDFYSFIKVLKCFFLRAFLKVSLDQDAERFDCLGMVRWDHVHCYFGFGDGLLQLQIASSQDICLLKVDFAHVGEEDRFR
jgi:hypothetical protein